MTKKPLKKDPMRSEGGEQCAAVLQARSADQAGRGFAHELPACPLDVEERNDELLDVLAMLRKSRDHYVNLYDFAPIGFLTLSLDGTIEEMNVTCAALLGAERDKLIHCNFDRLVADMERVRWHQLFPIELQQDRHHGCELTLLRGDSGSFHARLDSMGLSRMNGVSQLRFALTDVSERKNLERETHERRKEMDELQKLHVAAQTASAIAHELNQPLLAIASYSRAALLMLKSDKLDFGEICHALEGCEHQVHRAEQSIREMFDFLNSKEFPVEDFDLTQEIVLILDDARKEHELVFQSSLRVGGKLPLVRANRTHVQKALFNLLRNGIEAATGAASVPLPLITVTVGRAKDGNLAQVTVQDNGPGFTKEDAQYLFEPFFTTKGDGFGMGLCISRSLVEMNGGQLWGGPQEGPGAAFHLTVPLAA